MLFSWLKRRRRRRWLAERIPSTWEQWLTANVWQYRQLNVNGQRRVLEFVCILLHEKEWTSGRGFEFTKEMCVTIAGQAALMTLGFEEPYYFDRLQSIIIYPDAFTAEPHTTEGLFIGVTDDAVFGRSVRIGESWQGGPIVLAWDSVLRDGQTPGRGRNLVIHEFAHHMDSLDGSTNGAPPMTDFRFEKKWYRVLREEFRRLRRQASMGTRSLLDSYGATSEAEFFAVAAECFFTRPHQLATEHAELYAALERLFGQDPREWLKSF
jgi:Mlc titration factor MtfA (ptsG expression regulator)